MKVLNYQQKAIGKLVDETIDLLRLPGQRRVLVFKAPTGAGKTVMASQMLADLTEELQARGDSPYRQVAYIWIAPNKLHQQSYFKMKHFFTETRQLRPVMYDELDKTEGAIQPGEILFVNWESINKDTNVIVNDSELGGSLYEVTRRTQEEQGLPIVAIIDEEHLFWSKTADKSAKVLQRINPKVEVRISATPKTTSDHIVTIPREDVVAEEMIKKQVVLNPDVLKGYKDEQDLNSHLIKCALEKRRQLAEAYRQEGSNINPLLLIQLPNDTSESMTTEDTAIAEQVKAHLEVKDISIANHRLAVWLSNEKANLEGLETEDNITEVLLFKQAIAMGWDCPRAAVLLIFRKLQSCEFTIQTVGRILRMPEQRFYKNDLLNVGYVYTDLSRNQIQIVAEDMDYLNKDTLLSVRRENLRNVSLCSYYSVYKSSDRNRLGPDFKKLLIDSLIDRWQLTHQPTTDDYTKIVAAQNRRLAEARHICIDAAKVSVKIPADVVFQNEVGIIAVGERKEFARSAGEIHRIYLHYCRSLLGRFEKTHSTDVLAGYLMTAMEELFDFYETEAKKVILCEENKPKFTEIIINALDSYEQVLLKRKGAARDRAFMSYPWEVPAKRLYKESTHRVRPDVKDHALLPFVELGKASAPEQRFTAFLEKNSQYIDWWYKNGDEGKQHYSIPYRKTDGSKSLFYVDFIIKMKNGQLFLFDTKSGTNDLEAPRKHNALLAYMQSPEHQGLRLKGGVIIEEHQAWKYSDCEIETTANMTQWKSFFPDEYA